MSSLPRAGLAMRVWTLVHVALLVDVAMATYMPPRETRRPQKTNDLSPAQDHGHGKRYGYQFKDDRSVHRYLKLFGRDAMAWRCQNAIQPYWARKPLPFLELHCEAIGRLKAVAWYHNGHKIKLGDHYGEFILPHHANGHSFRSWLDFKFRIYNATTADSGVFTFEITGIKGKKYRKRVYVDISEKRKRKQERRPKLFARWHRNHGPK